jgi:hypothetical protein
VSQQEPDHLGLFANLGERAEFERRKVEHEDMVLDHRLSWLTTSQSILGTAYILRFTACVPYVIRIVLPAIALATCVLFHKGIRAAISASKAVTSRWDQDFAHHKGELLADPSRREQGWAPAKVVPVLLIVIWAFAVGYESLNLDCGVHHRECVECEG